jgi:hypothetical protein
LPTPRDGANLGDNYLICDADSSISHAFVCDQEKTLLKDRFQASIERMLEDHSQLNGVVGLKAALNTKYYSTMLDNAYFIYNY